MCHVKKEQLKYNYRLQQFSFTFFYISFKLVQLPLPPFLIQHLENSYATYGRLDEKDYDSEDAVQFSENVKNYSRNMEVKN